MLRGSVSAVHALPVGWLCDRALHVRSVSDPRGVTMSVLKHSGSRGVGQLLA